MDSFEEQLKQALARKEPPAGFAARVSAAASRRWTVREFYPGMAAALVLVMLGSGLAWRQHEGELAKERVMTAMRITAVKLNRIQAHVREVRQ
jgi:hypothetical protein